MHAIFRQTTVYYPLVFKHFQPPVKKVITMSARPPLIRELIRSGRHYFLSRSRRFSKSLLVSKLKELFEGNESLFEGLDIHPHWDWSVRHPAVRLSFGGKVSTPQQIENRVANQLCKIERAFDLKSLPSVHYAADRLENPLY